jgi:hypothetical protein
VRGDEKRDGLGRVTPKPSAKRSGWA